MFQGIPAERMRRWRRGPWGTHCCKYIVSTRCSMFFCAESMSSIWNICVSFPKWKVEHLRQTTHSWGPWQEKKYLDVSLLQKPVANLNVFKDSTIVGRRSTPLQGTLGHWLIREEMQKWRTFYVSMYPNRIHVWYIHLQLIDIYDTCR